ncbi:MAG TPA: SDR family oxidoreductase [Aestuariivirgaceae bacterium]|nr:SDR family oxidoreductase [Aestuariivirgaceae bacterium]
MRGLAGKRILVAGSATGIGAATARRLGQEGAHVFLGDFRIDAAELVAKDIQAAGGTAAAGFFDLHDEKTIETLVASAVGAYGGLDGLVNVAYEGRAEYHGRDVEILSMDPKVWEIVLHGNVIGTALMIKYALPHLVETGGGSIVNITSPGASAGESVRVVYGASKGALNSITRHVANTYGVRGVRCNCVSPGAILTEAGQAAFSQEMRKKMIASMPIKRLGQPEDPAATIAYLLSDDAEWITGQIWGVNGGIAFRE